MEVSKNNLMGSFFLIEHPIGGEGLEEEGHNSRRGSIRGAAGSSRGGADSRLRSVEEVCFK